MLCAGVAIQASAQTTPEASFATAVSSVNEDAGTVTVAVNLSSALSEDIRISYSLASDDGTASPTDDYNDASSDPGYVDLAAGATSVNIEIEIRDDDVPESNETLIVTLQDGENAGENYDAGSANMHTITIIDNDDPVVDFAPAVVDMVETFAPDVEENAGFLDGIVVRLNKQHERSNSLVIRYTVTGTATFHAFDTVEGDFVGGGDFGIEGLTNVNDAAVEVSSFTPEGYIYVAIDDDETEEEDETVILTLVDGDGYTVGNNSVFTITILKDDNDEGAVPAPKPTISITGTPAVFNEGDELTINVNSTDVVAADLDVTLTVSDAPGSDFLDASEEGNRTVEIPSGETTVAIQLPTGVNGEGNAVYDAPGTIMVTLASGADYDVDATASSVSLDGTDPDGPFVSFAAASGTIEEGAIQQGVDRNNDPVNYAVYHDFVVNIEPATPEPIEISFAIKDEGKEGGTTAIVDDYLVNFGDGVYAATSSVDVGVSMFTAQLATCPVNTSGFCPINQNTDVFAEGDETVIFEIVDGAVNGQGYRVGAQATHSVTIVDNEVTASFASASTVVEETVGTFDVTVNLDKAPERPIQIRYDVTHGSDDVDRPNDYVILNVVNEGIIQGVGEMGATTATISVEIVDDADMESDETLTLTLLGGVNMEEGAVPYENYVGAIAEHTITIRANDGGAPVMPPVTPVASFASASASAAESAGTQNVAINLSPAPSAAITLNYTLSGTATLDADYAISGVTSNNGTVSVNAGDTSVNIPVVITDDSADESNETVILTLASGAGYDVGSAAAYTLTITDNDGGSTTTTPPVTTPPATTPPAPTAASVTLSASPNPVAEGDSVTITVTPSQLLSSDATIPLVLTAGTAEAEDYSALASIVIEGNEPNGTGVIRARKDVDMDDETFTVSLGTLPSSVVAGTPASVEITIMDVGTVSAEADGQELPDAFALEQNYPNPFNPSTAIEYALPEAAHVFIEVFDATGRSAGVLVDGVRPAGRHSARFDAGSLPSGLYVYRMQAGGQTMVRKMTLVR